MPLPRVPLLAAATAFVKQAATNAYAGWRAFFFLKRVAIDDWSWTELAEMFIVYLEYSPDSLAEIKRMAIVALGGVFVVLAALAAIIYFVWRKKSNAFQEHVAVLVGRNAALSGRNTFLDGHNTFLAGRNTSLAGRNHVLTARNAVLTGCNTFLTGRNTSLTGRNTMLTERVSVLTGRNALLTERNAELTGYLNDAEETISIMLEKGWLNPPTSLVLASKDRDDTTVVAPKRANNATNPGTGEKRVEKNDSVATGGPNPANLEGGLSPSVVSGGNGRRYEDKHCKVRTDGTKVVLELPDSLENMDM